MEIISQNYEKILENLIINNFSDILKNNLNRNINENKVFNYIAILDTLDESLCKIAKESLVNIIESLDRGYKNSVERKHSYHIKSHNKRTIMTIFGEITYRKTIYSHKYFNKFYCFIDDYLGLKKYDYFDPYIKSMVIKYASDNPYSKVAKIINDIIFNRIKLDEPFQYISKQTVRNIVLNEPISEPEINQLQTPNDLYIMADEKFVSTQNNNNSDVMVKEIVVFDGKTVKNNRTTLNNKYSFASFNNSLLNKTLDYLYYVYDMDKIKNIYIMGDGANWIKNLKHYFKINNQTNVMFCLDKFHFKQAIHHITTDNLLEKYLTDYVLHNMKNEFINVCDSLITSYPHREETIQAKKDYILNNWQHINNLYNNNLKCPMESQISHTLADLLTSRPKAYSLKTLEKILKLRLLYKNKHNIKMLYLNNYNNKNIKTYKKDNISFKIFEKQNNYKFDESLLKDNYQYIKKDYSCTVKIPFDLLY